MSASPAGGMTHRCRTRSASPQGAQRQTVPEPFEASMAIVAELVPYALREIARAQCGVLSRRQLREAGVTADGVSCQIRAARWQGYGTRAVVLHNSHVTWIQRAWAAVLNAGSQPAAIAGASAARLQGLRGLRGYEAETVDLLIGHRARATASPGVVLHRTRRSIAESLHRSRTLPMTKLDRSLIDAASWAANDRAACAVLAAAVQQRLTTAGRLLAEARIAVRARRRHLLMLVLHDIEGGAHSLAELDFARLCRRAGIEVVRQTVRTDSRGRRRYLDVEIRFRGGKGTFAVEIDGALHLEAATYADDMVRGNDITIAGTPVLRFSALSVRLQPEAVLAQLRRMYESR